MKLGLTGNAMRENSSSTCKGAFINYGLGGVVKLEGGSFFSGILMGVVIFFQGIPMGVIFLGY